MAEFDTDYNYDDDIDNTNLCAYPGTCGTLVYPSLNRWNKETLLLDTADIREQGKQMGVGVIVTTCSEMTDEIEAWMVEAGWVKTLTYKGQYQQFDYEAQQSRSYKMTHWALILKPWEEK